MTRLDIIAEYAAANLPFERNALMEATAVAHLQSIIMQQIRKGE